MKRNILFLLCGLLISLGCGGGGTTDKDAGSTDVPEDIQDNDQTNTDVGEDVVEDAGTDQGSDSGGTDTIVPPGPDGKVGSPCAEDLDCFQEPGLGPDDDPTSICFMGFCTRFCRRFDEELGEAVPIEGACDDVSAASYLGPEWQCPGDYGICLPGQVGGISIGCTKDAECDDLAGGDYVCAGVVWDGSTGVDGVCMPALDRQDHSTECTEDTNCLSLFCIGNDPTTGDTGVCVAHCATGSDCPGGEGHICQAFGFLLPGEDGESSEDPGAWAGLCFPSTGSLDNCKYSDCPDGEACLVTTQPSTLIGQYNCVTGNDGGLAVAEICSANADCFSGNCMFDGLGLEEVTGYCSNVCPIGVDQCGEAMVCTEIVMNDKGTPDKDWDDPVYDLCVFDSETYPCFVDDSWCAESLDCTAVDGWPEEVEGLGLCVAGVPACEAYCGLVEANCTDDNAITFATDCLTDCASWPEGPEGATSGNSVQCRIYHLGVAGDDPATHCPHGSPEGGNFDVGFPCTDPDPVDLCEPNPCQNGGLCSVLDDAASCDCTGSGYEGDSCETDVDECAAGTAGCDTNAACTNTEGGYDCACNGGYGGDGTTCTDDDECTAGTDNCDANAACTNTDGSFSCACNAGFNGDGVNCSEEPLSDGEACADGSNCTSGFCTDGVCCNNSCDAACASCSGAESGGADGVCTLVAAGTASSCSPYLCTGSSFDCPTSCSGNADCTDGTFCIASECAADADECADGTHNCDANATCTNTEGSFSCACDSGYSGDGTTCTDDDECTAGTDSCDANATCVNVDGGFACGCDGGYSGNGFTCTDDDECTAGTDNCDANATCTNTAGGFDCACDSGYTGDGTTCADDDECASNPCGTNASCTNTPGSFSCACDSGYSGDGITCTDIDECATGTDSCTALEDCTNTVGGHSCSPAVIGYASHAQSVFQGNCSGCHANSPGSGGHNIAMDYSDATSPASHASCSGLTVGECALIRAGNGSMPPGPGSISADHLAILQAWVDGGLLP